jgi:hypothetical protein
MKTFRINHHGEQLGICKGHTALQALRSCLAEAGYKDAELENEVSNFSGDVEELTTPNKKHTPTPWKIDQYETVVGTTDEAFEIASCWTANSGIHKDFKECRANAEFIVRACNAHDNLVRALRSTLDHVAVPFAKRDAAWGRKGNEIFVQARAALAKAEGK